MAQILDFLRAAIQPAAAARAGYVQGQEQKRDKNRATEMQDASLKRQGLLDQIKASVDNSTITRNNAQAERARREPAAARSTYRDEVDDQGYVYQVNTNDPNDVKPLIVDGKHMKRAPSPKSSETPSTINTTEGIRLWNPTTRKYEATGFKAPASSRTGNDNGANAQERLDAKTALDEAVQAIPRPSTIPEKTLGTDAKGRATIITNPKRALVEKDSTEYDNNIVKPLRRHLLDVTVGTKVPLGGRPDGSAGASKPTSTSQPGMSKDRMSVMQTEFDAASADLKAVLNSNAPKEVKDQARALYDQQQTLIAKKYGATSPDNNDEQ